MQDVPKSVLKRLEETAATEVHPDANLLTAFAEQSLAEAERACVSEHLACCSNCRAVVALALPAKKTVAGTAFPSPVRRAWFAWPALRWGVVAAGILAVVSVGVLHYVQIHPRVDTVASNNNLRRESPIIPQQVPPPPSPAPQSSPQAESAKEQKTRVEAPSKRQETAINENSGSSLNAPHSKTYSGHAGGFGAGSGGGMAYGSGGGIGPAAIPKSPVPSPGARESAVPSSTSETVERQSQAAVIPTAPEVQGSDQLVVTQTEQAPADQSRKDSAAPNAKSPAVAQGTPGSAVSLRLALPKLAPETASGPAVDVPPRWTISAAGTLQRSFDAGNTWEEVNPEVLASGSAEAKIVGKVQKQTPMNNQFAAPPRTIFRAVSSIGSEVWAGGSGATLYHSTDSGAAWVRVFPASTGDKLTGDIRSIEFSDPQRVSVTTSTGEIWITADGGQNWSRR